MPVSACLRMAKGWPDGLINSLEATRKNWHNAEDKRVAVRLRLTTDIDLEASHDEARLKAFEARCVQAQAELKKGVA